MLKNLVLRALENSDKSENPKVTLDSVVEIITNGLQTRPQAEIILEKIFSYMQTVYLKKDIESVVESRLHWLEEPVLATDRNIGKAAYKLVSEISLILCEEEKSIKLRTLFDYLRNLR